eukprot:CAMPEP_0172676010 /NCGR_PEP_ID=MMETSP1074-20121228/13655_1 /TAXON_ID=2916 /ORGANISM="Ceratium fusus, Strain PA161109" /LENGTH=57 /DNA_ID=CAMNT_0013493563 /DNA_START=31 /DNA_END=204 /DNA_ORIENTATION=-
MAKTMKMQPKMSGRNVKTVMSPPMLNITLKMTSESTSSTKAAVITAWPKYKCSAFAS